MMTISQSEALIILQSGQNVFLTGGGGTGKSFVIRKYTEWLQRQGREVILCAPTGVAAENINGMTLHRTFHIPVKPIGPAELILEQNEYLDYVDVVIIDEISMVRFDVFDYVVRCIQLSEARTQKKKQLVVMGDFYQLPPVLSNEDREVLAECWGLSWHEINKGYAFLNTKWEDMNFLNIKLRETVRQEAGSLYGEILNELRTYNVRNMQWINQNSQEEEQYMDDGQLAITLCSTRQQAKEINDKEIEKLPGTALIYDAYINGDVRISGDEIKDCNLENKLYIKLGMRVMACINNPDENYQNGSMGIVTELNEESVEVAFDNGSVTRIYRYLHEVQEYVAEEDELHKRVVGTIWQFPIKPAYAITIHKSQGCTFEKMNLYPDCFEVGQLYVALSRVKSIEGLYLYNPILEEYIKESTAVKMFYRSFE